MTKRHHPCAICAPPIEPELGRQGESGLHLATSGPVRTQAEPSHVGARFRDGTVAHMAGLRYVFDLDGTDLAPDSVIEAMAGQPGWVITSAAVKAKSARSGLGVHDGLCCQRGVGVPDHVKGVLRKGHVTIRLAPK